MRISFNTSICPLSAVSFFRQEQGKYWPDFTRSWNAITCTALYLYQWGTMHGQLLTQKMNNDNNNRIQRRKLRFFRISSLRREPYPTRTLKWTGRNRVQITCNTSSAYHVQHVVLRATWYEGTAQLLSLTECKSHLFELYFIG